MLCENALFKSVTSIKMNFSIASLPNSKKKWSYQDYLAFEWSIVSFPITTITLNLDCAAFHELLGNIAGKGVALASTESHFWLKQLNHICMALFFIYFSLAFGIDRALGVCLQQLKTIIKASYFKALLFTFLPPCYCFPRLFDTHLM